MAYVVGVDGGGTKTLGIIADSSGDLLASSKRDSSNYLQVGIDKARENLLSMLDELAASQNIGRNQFESVYLGLAGAGRQEDRETITQALRSGGLTTRLQIVPDFLIGLAAGTLSDPGIIVISGTGSVVFGVNKEGQTKRAGGWGHILADEGAGYQFGQEALKAVMRAYDKRGPRTKLTKKVLAALNLKHQDNLVKWSLSETGGLSKPVVADLAPLVFEAYNEGDKVAGKIIDLACKGVAEAVKAAVKGLGMKEDSFKIVLAGGNFAHQPVYVEKLKPKLKKVAPNAEAVLPRFEPVVGAILLALKDTGITATPQILSNIEQTWTKI
ncbi:MAG: BadF/BadG/BcrA/BcrD ATPase family protein [bacterium]|nr:BadF/BadG/BcrA/BcrD ATPase family protein [bacterium]